MKITMSHNERESINVYLCVQMKDSEWELRSEGKNNHFWGYHLQGHPEFKLEWHLLEGLEGTILK